MSASTITTMQTDHKHWLKDIERWAGYLRTWQGQQTSLLAEVARFQDSIRQHGADLRKHADALEKHRNEILACERSMVENHNAGQEVESDLAEAHHKGAGHHDEQLTLHERIKQCHHTLMVQLALLRREPFRED
jgi:hypothetical protein